jgi:hypothetical protein
MSCGGKHLTTSQMRFRSTWKALNAEYGAVEPEYALRYPDAEVIAAREAQVFSRLDERDTGAILRSKE